MRKNQINLNTYVDITLNKISKDNINNSTTSHHFSTPLHYSCKKNYHHQLNDKETD